MPARAPFPTSRKAPKNAPSRPPRVIKPAAAIRTLGCNRLFRISRDHTLDTAPSISQSSVLVSSRSPSRNEVAELFAYFNEHRAKTRSRNFRAGTSELLTLLSAGGGGRSFTCSRNVNVSLIERSVNVGSSPEHEPYLVNTVLFINCNSSAHNKYYRLYKTISNFWTQVAKRVTHIREVNCLCVYMSIMLLTCEFKYLCIRVCNMQRSFVKFSRLSFERCV